jgi:hypothetical protein
MVAKIVVPNGEALVGVRYTTCRNGRTTLSAVHLDGPLADGVHERIWWRVRSRDAPDRYFRTSAGARSVQKLINTYALLDKDACLNIDAAELVTEPAGGDAVRRLVSQDAHAALGDAVPRRALGSVYGVPQRQIDSGICWYAALMFVVCHNLRVRAHVKAFLPPHVGALLDRCLTDAASSEELRKALWETYTMGDPYGQPPEFDGQNGVTQFYVLAGRVGMPVLRYFVDAHGVAHKLTDPVTDPKEGRVDVTDVEADGRPARLLTFRFRRGAHVSDPRVQPMRRKTVCGRRYRLVGMMIGSEHCGHQISACARDASWRDWAVCDSDAQHRGIGVTHWSFTAPVCDRGAWWQAWRLAVPTVRFHGGYCNLSPHNPPTHAQSSQDAGMTNVDFVYFADDA